MMQECPRCHFVQPKDQYCANCGLDIDSFTPAPESMIKKASRNTGLQMALVVAAVLSAGALIFYSQKEKLAQHLRHPLQSFSETNNTPATLDTVVSVDDPVESDSLATPAAGQEGENAEGTTALSATDDGTSTEAQAKKKFSLSFAEVSSGFVSQLASEGQILNETAQRRSFTYGNTEPIATLKERDPELRMIPRAIQSPLRSGTPILADFTHVTSTNEDIGLTLEITPNTLADGNVEVSIVGNIHLRDEGGGTIVNQEINANYSFSSKNTLVLVGFLPRQPIRAEDLTAFANTPLVIYESLNFLNGLTDFAIFIQAK